MTYALWIVQGPLALLFLFTGGMKLLLPLEQLTGRCRCRACLSGSSGWPRCSARSA